MIRNVYGMRDELVGFVNVNIDQNDDIAKRNFLISMRAVAEKVPVKDYSLYFLGFLDEESGIFTQDGVPKLLCRGGDLVE